MAAGGDMLVGFANPLGTDSCKSNMKCGLDNNNVCQMDECSIMRNSSVVGIGPGETCGDGAAGLEEAFGECKLVMHNGSHWCTCVLDGETI